MQTGTAFLMRIYFYYPDTTPRKRRSLANTPDLKRFYHLKSGIEFWNYHTYICMHDMVGSKIEIQKDVRNSKFGKRYKDLVQH